MSAPASEPRYVRTPGGAIIAAVATVALSLFVGMQLRRRYGGAQGAAVLEPPLSPLRKRVLSLIDELVPSQYPEPKWKRLAPAYDPENLPSENYTTCGELPRYIGSQIGINTRGGLASVRDLGRANGAWIDAGENRRPKSGDFYLVGDGHGAILHVGIILDASSDTVWKTADAGQGPKNRQAAAKLERAYDPVAGTLCGVNGPRRVLGWLDIDKATQPQQGPAIA